MKAYISVSFGKRPQLQNEINSVLDVLRSRGINGMVFVDIYKFSQDQEKEMMDTAMWEIDNCDFLIAETSDKGIGIGIEVGYAKAKGKPVIYLRNAGAEHSTTVSGISDYSVVYKDVGDLRRQLGELMGLIR